MERRFLVARAYVLLVWPLLGLALSTSVRAQSKEDPLKLIESYTALDLDEKAQGERPEVVFDDASKDRICLEHRLVACGKAAVKPLVTALASENRHVRAMAAEVLGAIGDKTAAPALAAAAKGSDATTRIYAIQSLAWLKSGKDVIDAAAKDSDANVAFVAKRAQEQLAAAPRVHEAFSGVDREKMDSAEVGKPAPDFSLPTADGKTWKLSEQKGIVVLLFQLADW